MNEATDIQAMTEFLETLASRLDRSKPLRRNKTRSGVELRFSGRQGEFPVTVSIASPWEQLVLLGTDNYGKHFDYPVFVLENRPKREPLATWGTGVYRTKGPSHVEDHVSIKVRKHIASQFVALGLRRLQVKDNGQVRMEIPTRGMVSDIPEKRGETMDRCLALLTYLFEQVCRINAPRKSNIYINGVPIEIALGGTSKRRSDRVTCPYCLSKVVPPEDNHCPNCGAPLP